MPAVLYSLALLLGLQFAIDISFNKFKSTLVQFLQQGQDSAQDVFVSVVASSCLSTHYTVAHLSWLSVTDA